MYFHQGAITNTYSSKKKGISLVSYLDNILVQTDTGPFKNQEVYCQFGEVKSSTLSRSNFFRLRHILHNAKNISTITKGTKVTNGSTVSTSTSSITFSVNYRVA